MRGGPNATTFSLCCEHSPKRALILLMCVVGRKRQSNPRGSVGHTCRHNKRVALPASDPDAVVPSCLETLAGVIEFTTAFPLPWLKALAQANTLKKNVTRRIMLVAQTTPVKWHTPQSTDTQRTGSVSKTTQKEDTCNCGDHAEPFQPPLLSRFFGLACQKMSVVYSQQGRALGTHSQRACRKCSSVLNTPCDVCLSISRSCVWRSRSSVGSNETPAWK